MSDLDISFKKSQVQLSAYYKTIDSPDADICKPFEEELRKSPQKILDQMKAGSDSPFGKNLQSLKDQVTPPKAEGAAKEEASTEEVKKTVHDEL